MPNAVNLNLLAFWRYTSADRMDGQALQSSSSQWRRPKPSVAASILAVYRQRRTINVPELDLMQG
jgi:NADH:ubiquinone oxidoreductase subunit K